MADGPARGTMPGHVTAAARWRLGEWRAVRCEGRSFPIWQRTRSSWPRVRSDLTMRWLRPDPARQRACIAMVGGPNLMDTEGRVVTLIDFEAKNS